MIATELAKRLPAEVRREFLKATPEMQRKILRIYREHPDGRGRGREITSPPACGNSRKHPWRR